MDKTTPIDRTERVNATPTTTPRTDAPRVITLPPKDRVNMALAAVAGALLILVIVVGHDTFSRAAAATPPPSLHTLTPATPAATAAVPAPAPGGPAKGGAKGKGHD